MPHIVYLVDNLATEKRLLGQGEVVIGRSVDSDIQLSDLAVSHHHAVIRCLDEAMSRYLLCDLQSTNSTFVNDVAVDEYLLRHGDIIRVGWVSFRYIDENASVYEKTQKIKKSWIPGIYYSK